MKALIPLVLALLFAIAARKLSKQLPHVFSKAGSYSPKKALGAFLGLLGAQALSLYLPNIVSMDFIYMKFRSLFISSLLPISSREYQVGSAFIIETILGILTIAMLLLTLYGKDFLRKPCIKWQAIRLKDFALALLLLGLSHSYKVAIWAYFYSADQPFNLPSQSLPLLLKLPQTKLLSQLMIFQVTFLYVINHEIVFLYIQKLLRGHYSQWISSILCSLIFSLVQLKSLPTMDLTPLLSIFFVLSCCRCHLYNKSNSFTLCCCLHLSFSLLTKTCFSFLG